MRKTKWIFLGSLAFTCACSSDEGGSANDTQPVPAKSINGCVAGSTYADRTASQAVTVVWDILSGPSASDASKRTCLTVKSGTTVTWQTVTSGSFEENFKVHPLASKDGDTPSPILTTNDETKTAISFRFDQLGTYGFVCLNHSNMTGAIYVVP